MTRNIALSLTLLAALLAGVMPIPQVAAAPPTMDCEVNFIPDASSNGYFQFTFAHFDYPIDYPFAVLADGTLVFSHNQLQTNGGTYDSVMKRLNTGCGTIWSQGYDCPSGNFACRKDGLIADPSGHIIAYRTFTGPDTP